MNERSDPATSGPPQRQQLFRQLPMMVARSACLAVLLFTVATLPARVFWISDLLANLRVQQLIAIVVSVLLCVSVKQYRLVLIASICFSLHFAFMFVQLTPIRSTTATGGTSVRVMTMNVLTSNRSFQQVMDEIGDVDPDLVAVIELNSDLDQFLREKLAAGYPHAVSRPQDRGNFGIGIYSKQPLIDPQFFELNEDIASVEVGFQGHRVIATHPLPPMGRRGFRSRNEHLSLLAERIAQDRNRFPRSPIIVLGDFNVTPWSPHFDEFQRQSGLRRARRGAAVTPTWYARGSSFPLGLVLDHVFISDTLHCAEYRVGRDIGSDHRSVCVLLSH